MSTPVLDRKPMRPPTASRDPARRAPTRPAGSRPRPLPGGAGERPEGTAYVRWVQGALNELLGLRLRTTGSMDAPSRSALRRFQVRQGLAPTGRLGLATRRALVAATTFVPLDDGELDHFLGKITRGISRAARSAGRAVTAVSRALPLAQLASAASRAVPFSVAARAAWGGVAAGLSGKNVLGGAVRAAVPSALGRFALDTGRAVARGEKLTKAIKGAAGAGVADVREQLRFAQMVAPFVPGVGTGVAAALGAANALADGKPITAALVAAARGSLPGGAVSQTAFDVGVNLARGRKLSEAALTAARNALPGGPLAKAAFDTAVALSEGKRLQDAALDAARRGLPGGRTAQAGFDLAVGIARGKKPGDLAIAAARARLPGPAARAAFDGAIAAAGGTPASREIDAPVGFDRIETAASDAAARILRRSPFAADPLSFVKAAARGQDLQRSALSTTGQLALAGVRA